MNKAKELLKELQNLGMDIQSRIDEINELEAGLLSSPKWIDVKVQGGQARKVDDVYTQLVVMKEAIEQDTKEVINRKLELGRLINKLKNPKSRSILRVTYITKMYVDDICDKMEISRTTFYTWRNMAISELNEVLERMELN
ncbi:phage protein [Streptococcus pneumoniae]|nr:phage protein [Streptococcus pneumoniae]